MAQLKDLIVNGASQLIGDVTTNNIQITELNAPIASNGSTYGIGSEGQVLLTNGNSIYWGTIASTSVTGLAPIATSGSYNDLNNKPTLFSGSYNDLSDKPTIPAAQVQTDWNATTGIGAILNKPTLSTVATSGSYNDLSNKPNLFSGDYNDLTNKPTIPDAQVQTDWNATSGMGAILNKPTLAPVATSGSYNDLSNKPTDINWTLKGGTEISTNENLNDYITPGNYYCTSDANAKTITNNPLGTNAQAFILKVSCSTGATDTYLRQELQFYQHKKKYIRYCTNANNRTWSSWENTVLSGDSFGNISNSGTLQTTDVTIASGDKLIITDASDSHKIARTSTVFDGATNIQTLTRKGEWASPIEYIEGLIDESTSSSWVGVTKDTSLYAGKLVAFHIPCDSVSNRCTLTLKLNNGNGNNTSALAIYENFGAENNTYFQTVYTAGTIVLLAFNGSKWVIVNKQQLLDLYEAKLKWGGQNFTNDFGPIDAAMISDLGANRLAFANPAGITIEYSTDNGVTWNDYGATNEDKLRLFSTGKNYYLGQHTAEGTSTLSDMLRITIDSINAKIYTILNKIAIYMSSQGHTNWIKIEAATQGDPNTYKVFTDWEHISGWSGWNILNFEKMTTCGNIDNDSQYRYIRLSFKQTALYKNPEPSAAIIKILGFGGVGWVTPSEMAKTGHLYAYDYAQNVTFPAKISFKNSLDKKATFSVDSLTENRVYTLPNSSGTLALAGEAPTAHMHGYIKSDGDISSSYTAEIANGDRLIINDESESKITNSSITFGTSETQVLSNKGTWVSLPTAASLGLSSALRFVGITTQTIIDGSQLSPIPINEVDHTPTIGDVIISQVNGSDNEFVWTGSSWELLGRDSSFKLVQSSEVSTPATVGYTTAFIDTISQNTNGDITVTKKNLDTSGTWSGIATTATKLSNTENIGNTNKPVYINSEGVPTPISYEVNVTVPTNAIFTDEKVKQVNQNSTNNDYRILLSGSADDNEKIENVNKNTNLRFNPFTKIFSIGGSVSATGDLSITGNTSLAGETEINSVNAGNLLVTGGTTFSQIPSSPTPANTSNDTSVATTAFVKTAISTNVVDYNNLSNKPTIPAAQVNADWNATSGVAEILNKPTIPAAQVQTDWDATTGISSIKNKPTLATVATTGSYNNLSDKPSLFSGDYNDLTNKPNIPAAQIQVDWNSTSGLSSIINKPTLASVATSGSYNDLNNKPTLFSGSYNDLSDKPTIPAAQIQTDWDATSGISSIKNKPTLASVATSGSYNDLSNKPNLFSGDYNDLSNKPTIPSAQVQTDWDATTGMAAILNKPTLAPVATSGSYNDLNNKPSLFSGNYNDLTNKPTIPAAQVQTDWNATTGISSIKNKPTLSTVATSGSYNDLSNKPSLNFLPLTGGEVTGNITLKVDANNPNTGTLSTKNLIITNTDPDFGIQFLRTGTSISNAPNYIQFPASSRLNFIGQEIPQANSGTSGNAVSMMILESDPTNPSIFPGTTDWVNLGTTSLKWNNIYTKTVTLSQDPVNNLEAATKRYVDNAFAVNDAMIFKGTIGTGGTVTTLPTTHNIGWTYRVITAGPYANINCEIGDLIICIEDGTSANNTHWTVAQTNIDGAVTGPAGGVNDGNVAVFSGTSGHIIKKGTTNTENVVKTITFNGGTTPTLGDNISADDITNWSQGTLPSLSIDTVSCDDITGWTAGSVTTAAVTNGVLTITTGTASSLSYTSREVGSASDWDAGALPSLSYTSRNIPNVTSIGTKATLTTTSQSVITSIS